MNPKTIRYLLVTITLVLSIGLYFAPSQVNTKPQVKVVENAGMPIEALIETAKKSLADEQLGYVNALEAMLASDSSNLSLLDSLARLWDEAGIPALSAWYCEQKAIRDPTEKNHLDAAFRYFDAFKIAGDSMLKSDMASKAIAMYEKVIALNPSNLNAKTDLGVIYAEGSKEPMKGIMLLREVLNEDPQHEMAQLNMGFLSVKSGQLDKAIDRFTTVRINNPKRIDVFYFLGHTYYEAGKKDSALYWLEKFKKESDDYRLVQQASVIIEKINS